MGANFQQILVTEVKRLLEPFAVAAESPVYLRELFDDIGWNLDAITGLPIADLEGVLQQFVTNYNLVLKLIDQPPESLGDLEDAINAVQGTINSIRQLGSILDRPGLVRPPHFDEIGKDLVSFLAYRYLRVWHPTAYLFGGLLTIIRVRERNEFPDTVTDGNEVLRFPSAPPVVIEFSRIESVLRDPVGVLKAEYLGANGLATAKDAKAAAEKLFPLLGEFLSSIGIHSRTGYSLSIDGDLGIAGNALAETMLTLLFPLGEDRAPGGAAVGVTLTLSSADLGNLGLVVAPFGTLQFSDALGSWKLDLDLTAGVDAFAIGPSGFVIAGDSGTERFDGKVALTKVPGSDGNAFLIGSTTGTRLEIGLFRGTLDASLEASKLDYGILLEVGSATLIIKPGDGDIFLKKVLPTEGLPIKFDLGIGWSNKKGLYFKGSASLEATLPVSFTVGPFSLLSIYLAIKAPGSEVSIVVAPSFKVKIGPVEATVDRVGLKSVFSFPDDGGNLGPVNLDFGFKPPNGIGLVIDGGGFKGGGFLSYDSGPPEIYSGALLLKAQKISISAFGVFEKSASGVTSFAFILGVRFNPGIELGFGFSLTGVGGVVGINRHLDVDAMRERLTSGTAGDLFFTDDPVKNAPRLLGDMQSLMPAAEGIYTFGPTLRITWLKKAIFDIAILIELPGPSKVVLVGVARLTIGGDEEKKIKPVLKLRIDVLGVIDFTKKHIQFDATIVDSTLMQIFKLSGDAALQMDAGEKPYVMLAIGGFHPAFKPEPAVFRKLKRITGVYEPAEASPLALSMAGYLAVTTNTFQLGAQITATLKAGSSVTIEGQIGFDALIQFQPFHFVIDFSAKVRVKVKGHNVAGVTFKGTISGPGPVIIYGKFCIEILFFDFCFSHSFQIGDSGGELPAVVANLLEALRAEVTLANLEAAEIDDLLSINKDRATTDNPLFPAGQVMTFSQKKAPLGLPLSRFDGVPLSKQQAAVISVDPSISATLSPVEDWFSPGSFANLTQSQALNMPAFQRLSSGTTLDLGMSGDVRATHEFKYDVRFIPETPAADDPGLKLNLSHPESLLDAISGRAAAPRVFAASPIIGVTDEQWEIRSGGGTVKANRLNEAEAHQRALMIGAVALPAGDVITLNGV